MDNTQNIQNILGTNFDLRFFILNTDKWLRLIPCICLVFLGHHVESEEQETILYKIQKSSGYCQNKKKTTYKDTSNNTIHEP